MKVRRKDADVMPPLYPPNLPVDLGAAAALRYLEDAAREAESDEPLLVTIARARDKLWAQMDATYPKKTA